MDNTFLEHIGVKRKSGRYPYGSGDRPHQHDGLLKGRKAKKAIKVREDQMRKDAKNRRILSDQDLRRKIERIKLERELATLTAEELTPGRKAAKEVLARSGKRVAEQTVTAAMKAVLRKAFDKDGDVSISKEIANSLAAPSPDGGKKKKKKKDDD